ncbi:hypothetical protein [Halobacteriovorax sp. JY17]|nr:hypothetical protein [Halobacteriovorax sp. JY17]
MMKAILNYLENNLDALKKMIQEAQVSLSPVPVNTQASEPRELSKD